MNALDRLVARIRADPYFLAYSLHRYAQRHGFDDAALADALGIDARTLIGLRLCRTPVVLTWQADVEAIAAWSGVDPALLTEVVRS
jgi:hypothetical protein